MHTHIYIYVYEKYITGTKLKTLMLLAPNFPCSPETRTFILTFLLPIRLLKEYCFASHFYMEISGLSHSTFHFGDLFIHNSTCGI